MKFNLRLCCFCVSLAFIMAVTSSCHREPGKFTKPFQVDSTWSALVIVAEGDQQIEINNFDNDSSRVFIYHHGSFFAPVPKNKWCTDTLVARFTKAEKDTLVYLAKDLIINHVTATNFCTEYVGSLRLTIRYKQFTLNGEYSSVCNWTTLSDKTLKLYKILKRRIKVVYSAD